MKKSEISRLSPHSRYLEKLALKRVFVRKRKSRRGTTTRMTLAYTVHVIKHTVGPIFTLKGRLQKKKSSPTSGAFIFFPFGGLLKCFIFIP